MTLASSPCCDSSSQASSIEAARAYSKGGDFNLRPQDADSRISRRLHYPSLRAENHTSPLWDATRPVQYHLGAKDASGRNYETVLDVGCGDCGVHRTWRGAGAIVAHQAGDGGRAVHRRQRDRHHGAHGGATAVGAARPALRGREPPRSGRHHRRRRRRPGRAGRPHHPGAFVVLHHHADDLSQHGLTTPSAIWSASRRWRCFRTYW